ncbi:MAG: sodium:proton antiporter NhaD [Mucinivorans sp.]
MFLLMISVFLAGIVLIAMEDKIGVNKSAVALVMSVTLWVIASLGGVDVYGENGFVEQLGDVSETLFFVMGALVIVELVDVHGGFRIISDRIKTTNKRYLLYQISILTFLLSAFLDNIATGVIMIALLRKFIPTQKERWIYASMVIIAANAGGAFSPVGDVTTILLWTGGNLTPLHQVSHLLLPAFVSMVIPMLIISRTFTKGDHLEGDVPIRIENANLPEISKRSRIVILVLGVSTMILVPVFQNWSNLPPFMRVMLGMAFMWIYTDLMYGRNETMPEENKLRVGNILSRIDMSTIMFFLGVLLSVAALKVSGQLNVVGAFFESSISDPLGISFVIGLMSAFVDNVALVAATQGMYPVSEIGVYAMNSEFWTFLAYCAVTGGSLLIIGSATGVTVMGMEKISFMYYLKRFSLIALIGYLAGAGVFLLIA